MLKGAWTLIDLNLESPDSNRRDVFPYTLEVFQNLVCFALIDAFSVSTVVVNVLVLTLVLIAVCMVVK